MTTPAVTGSAGSASERGQGLFRRGVESGDGFGSAGNLAAADFRLLEAASGDRQGIAGEDIFEIWIHRTDTSCASAPTSGPTQARLR